MFYVDSDRCTGCGTCASLCPQGAIRLQDGVAVIDQVLCRKCGDCTEVCPENAIRAKATVYAEPVKGGNTMMRGRNWPGGQGRGGGSGFGFRGSSPPWPYVGRGRGGLPRCYYPGLYGGSPAGGVAPYSPPAVGQEVDFLKEEASALKKRLEEIEARIKGLETK
jgi:NAD-dependent dihydropyrimidine dehydrogenase PreA subunit